MANSVVIRGKRKRAHQPAAPVSAKWSSQLSYHLQNPLFSTNIRPHRGSRNDMKAYLPPSRLTSPEPTCVRSSAAPNIDRFFANIACCT